VCAGILCIMISRHVIAGNWCVGGKQ
jgi:hypothetical protein